MPIVVLNDGIAGVRIDGQAQCVATIEKMAITRLVVVADAAVVTAIHARVAARAAEPGGE